MNQTPRLLNPPRARTSAGAIIGLLIFASAMAFIIWRNWPADETPVQAQAVAMPSETPSPTFTPTPTRNYIVDTVQAGQLEIIAMEKLNLAAAGTLQVEESNQRQRHAEQMQQVKLTEQTVLFTFVYTSTQEAHQMSMSVSATEAADERNREATDHQVKLYAFVFLVCAICGTVFAFVIAIWRRVIAAWDDAGKPQPIQPEEREIHTPEGNLKYPLAGLDCTAEELEIISGIVQSASGLVVRPIVAAGITRDRWRKIRSDFIDRGLLVRKRDDAQRIRVVPTADGWAVFNKVAAQ